MSAKQYIVTIPSSYIKKAKIDPETHEVEFSLINKGEIKDPDYELTISIKEKEND